MRPLILLACAFMLPRATTATDHGPVFSYATPVNSQGEFSFDSGIFGRNGSGGTQFSTGSLFGYGVTPQLTVTAFLPLTFGSGSLPESRMIETGTWSAGAGWRFQHSVTTVGKRVESTASLSAVLPGPQTDSDILGQLHRAPGFAATLASGVEGHSAVLGLPEDSH